jgi:hypothetical protein
MQRARKESEEGTEEMEKRKKMEKERNIKEKK